MPLESENVELKEEKEEPEKEEPEKEEPDPDKEEPNEPKVGVSGFFSGVGYFFFVRTKE